MVCSQARIVVQIDLVLGTVAVGLMTDSRRNMLQNQCELNLALETATLHFSGFDATYSNSKDE